MNSLKDVGRYKCWEEFLGKTDVGKAIARCIHDKGFWIPPGSSRATALPHLYIARRITSMYGSMNDQVHAGALQEKAFAINEDAAGPQHYLVALCIAEALGLVVTPFFAEEFRSEEQN